MLNHITKVLFYTINFKTIEPVISADLFYYFGFGVQGQIVHVAHIGNKYIL